MFKGCISLKNLSALKEWKEISSVKGMFEGCSSLHNLDGLQDWIFKDGYIDKYNFSNMFKGCSSLQNLDEIKGWNVRIENLEGAL